MKANKMVEERKLEEMQLEVDQRGVGFVIHLRYFRKHDSAMGVPV